MAQRESDPSSDHNGRVAEKSGESGESNGVGVVGVGVVGVGVGLVGVGVGGVGVGVGWAPLLPPLRNTINATTITAAMPPAPPASSRGDMP